MVRDEQHIETSTNLKLKIEIKKKKTLCFSYLRSSVSICFFFFVAKVVECDVPIRPIALVSENISTYKIIIFEEYDCMSIVFEVHSYSSVNKSSCFS